MMFPRKPGIVYGTHTCQLPGAQEFLLRDLSLMNKSWLVGEFKGTNFPEDKANVISLVIALTPLIYQSGQPQAV